MTELQNATQTIKIAKHVLKYGVERSIIQAQPKPGMMGKEEESDPI
jgi:hypothetical protein